MAVHPERREHPRLATELPVRLELLERVVVATAVNLGEQGARLVSGEDAAPRRGDEVLLELPLADGQPPIRVLGWVAATAPVERGTALSVTFFALPEADAARIRRAVAEVGPLTPPDA